jgi:hypothetical protein
MPPNNTGSAPLSTSGNFPSVSDSRSGSPASSTHRPSVLIPTGTTSYLSRSITLSTPAAVTHEIACSLDRPPNTTATLGFRSIPSTPATLDPKMSTGTAGPVRKPVDRISFTCGFQSKG